MRTEHITEFSEAELPQSDHERLLRLLFGGLAANTDSPAAVSSVVDAGDAGAFDVTRAEPGAKQVRSADALPSVPAAPGSATTGRTEVA